MKQTILRWFSPSAANDETSRDQGYNIGCLEILSSADLYDGEL
jgi:hypothetical protein